MINRSLEEVFVIVIFIAGVLASFHDVPKGDYCGGRTIQCCDGRIDECAIPILGTLCYCDQFCNRTDSDDCCPDYWFVSNFEITFLKERS